MFRKYAVQKCVFSRSAGKSLQLCMLGASSQNKLWVFKWFLSNGRKFARSHLGYGFKPPHHTGHSGQKLSEGSPFWSMPLNTSLSVAPVNHWNHWKKQTTGRNNRYYQRLREFTGCECHVDSWEVVLFFISPQRQKQ